MTQAQDKPPAELVAYVEVDGRRVPVYAARSIADVARRAVVEGRRALSNSVPLPVAPIKNATPVR